MGLAAYSEAIKIGDFHEEQNLGQQGVRSNCFSVTSEVLSVKRGQQGNLGEDNVYWIRNLHVPWKCSYLDDLCSDLPSFHLSFRFFCNRMSVTVICGLYAHYEIYAELQEIGCKVFWISCEILWVITLLFPGHNLLETTEILSFTHKLPHF